MLFKNPELLQARGALCKLPPEIRVIMLQDLVIRSAPVPIVPNYANKAQFQNSSKKVELQILQVCQIMNREVLHTLCHQNALGVSFRTQHQYVDYRLAPIMAIYNGKSNEYGQRGA